VALKRTSISQKSRQRARSARPLTRSTRAGYKSSPPRLDGQLKSRAHGNRVRRRSNRRIDQNRIGANLKFMKGRVYGNQVIVLDNDSGEAVEKSDEYYEETNNFGIDIGILYRMPMFNFGLVGRNLNSPKFDGPTVVLPTGTITFDDVRIDPQAAFGLAFIPIETFTLEADIDLTKNKTTLTDYETQNVMVGLEWDVFRFLALRGGAYKNLAEDDIDWVYTAGLGLNFWAVRIDLAGAMSSSKEQFDDDDIPKETRASLQLSVDF